MSNVPGPLPIAPEPAPGQSIGDYLARNRDRFTPAALRAELVRAGHAPSAVDAALALDVLAARATENAGAVPTSRPPGLTSPPPARPRLGLLFGDTRGSVRRRIGVWLLRLAHVATFLVVAWWYTRSMSGIGAVVAGILLALGLGIGFFAALTAFGESAAKLERGGIVTGLAAGLAAPLLVLLVLTGICVAVSRPIDWLTGGI